MAYAPQPETVEFCRSANWLQNPREEECLQALKALQTAWPDVSEAAAHQALRFIIETMTPTHVVDGVPFVPYTDLILIIVKALRTKEQDHSQRLPLLRRLAGEAMQKVREVNEATPQRQATKLAATKPQKPTSQPKQPPPPPPPSATAPAPPTTAPTLHRQQQQQQQQPTTTTTYATAAAPTLHRQHQPATTTYTTVEEPQEEWVGDEWEEEWSGGRHGVTNMTRAIALDPRAWSAITSLHDIRDLEAILLDDFRLRDIGPEYVAADLRAAIASGMRSALVATTSGYNICEDVNFTDSYRRIIKRLMMMRRKESGYSSAALTAFSEEVDGAGDPEWIRSADRNAALKLKTQQWAPGRGSGASRGRPWGRGSGTQGATRGRGGAALARGTSN